MARAVVSFLAFAIVILVIVGVWSFCVFMFSHTNAGIDVQTHAYVHYEPHTPAAVAVKSTPAPPASNDLVQLKMLEVLTKMTEKLDRMEAPLIKPDCKEAPIQPSDEPVTIQIQ